MTPTSTTFAEISNGLVYGAIAVYALAMLAYAAETARRTAATPPKNSERTQLLGAIGTSLTVLGFSLTALGALARGLAAGRVPWGNMYEFVLVCAVAAGAAYLAFLTRQPVRAFGVWIVALILLALGLAVTVLYTPAGALVPVLDSYWLVIHVTAAITGGGVFTVGAVASGLFLVRHRQERRAAVLVGASTAAEVDRNAGRDSEQAGERAGERAGEPAGGRRGRYAATLPPSATLEQVAHTAHIFAFPIWTFAVIAGAIWAENSWGRYWGWDPKETWAFITWVLYAAHLHAQATAGWRGVRASWFALAGYAAFLFNFFGVNMWITGLHSYAGI